MAPSDGNRASRIPTLSWNSILDSAEQDDSGGGAGSARSDGSGESREPIVETPIVFQHLSLGLPATPTAPLVPPADPPASAASLLLAPEPVVEAEPVVVPEPSIESKPVVVAEPSVQSKQVVVPEPSVESKPVMEAKPVVGAKPVVAGSDDEIASTPSDDLDDVSVRTTLPTVIVPVLGDVTSGPQPVVSAPATIGLPDIQEATPSAPVVALLPSVPAAVQRPVAAPAFVFDPASVYTPPIRQAQRRKSHGVMKLILTLVVISGLVAGGVVFGQPYLFPSEVDDGAAPYAQAVETIRGFDFVEPLAITAEPSAEFVQRLQAQLAPTTPDELAQWRALGLTNGVVDDSTLAQQLTGWQNSLYSTSDGQVYRDIALDGVGLDAELVQAVAAASLDQEFGWSTNQAGRTLDAAAATAGEVIGQARLVQADSDFTGDVDPAATDQAGAFPPVIGYRLLAPLVFAEFTTQQTPNPLSGLGLLGPGPLGSDVPVVAGTPSMVDGDVMVGSPVAKDRSFWFLVLGGFLDGPTAFAASEAIVENSVTQATRGTTSCVYATFSGGGVEQTEILRSALAAWTAAAPVEFASALTALPDGSLQLSSCDPGAGFTGSVRSGVANELIAWRAVELATYEAVTESGGDDTAIVNAWGLIGASNAPLEVAALPAGTSPSDIAQAARDAVSALYVPVG